MSKQIYESFPGEYDSIVLSFLINVNDTNVSCIAFKFLKLPVKPRFLFKFEN